MKIVKLELFKVPPRWLFLKITTANGTEGWGEPIVEGKASTVKAAVEEMAPFVLGKDARRIEDIWQVLYRGGFYRGGFPGQGRLCRSAEITWVRDPDKRRKS